MKPVRLKVLATELGGRCRGEDAVVTGAAIDSRQVQPGDLFFALPGQLVDGHDFLSAAAQAGASAAVVSRFVDVDLPQWCVDDPRRLLVEVACRARSESQARVIGLTGSNGKTTVKEMLAGILSNEAPTLATEGNRNNELGVPLTLCRLNPEHAFAVIEMGCGRPGDIALLASWGRPGIGLVNNAGPAHLSGFGSVEAVARCKGELLEALPASGQAIINADDAFAATWEQQAAHCHIQRFSLEGHPAEISGEVAEDGALRIRLPGTGELTVNLALSGRHNRANALAAATTAHAAGAGPAAIQKGLEAMRPVAGRLRAVDGINGSRIIDDSYNANPASLNAAMAALADESGPLWLALGEMAELGPDARRLHAEAGAMAKTLGVSRLFALGPLAAETAVAFGDGGIAFDDHDAMINAIAADLGPGVRVLVKGSRAARMEKVVAGLERSPCGEDASCC